MTGLNASRRLRIVGVGGWSWESEEMVQDWVTNMEQFCDEVVIVDQREESKHGWPHEGEYRKKQRALLEQAKADWAVVSSPDERWEDGAAEILRPLVQSIGKRRVLIGFPLMELFEPDAYRVDGIWGRKRRTRMYPVLRGQRYTSKSLQTSPVPTEGGYRKHPTDVRLYHLKNIDPTSREMRARAYEAMDPEYKLIPKSSVTHRLWEDPGNNRWADQGYHYLYDMKGAEFRKIEEGRGYSPAYDAKRMATFAPEWARHR